MIHTIWNLVLSAFIVGTGALLVLNWLSACGAKLPACLGPAYNKHRGYQASRRELWLVFGGAILFRVLVALLAAAFLAGRGLTGLEGTLSGWMRWDAWHYVNLVDLGYAGYVEDGQHLFLVFFPLYVWIVRLVKLMVGNTMLAGMLVSWLCYAGGCVYTYRLAALEFGRTAARRTVCMLSLFPYAFFFGGTMTEGLFLLTTAASLYYIRTHRWLAAGIWGALAALTRMQGLLMVGVAFAELMQAQAPLRKQGAKRRCALLEMARCLPLILLPALGTLAYLGLNQWVDGNPFSFVRQQQHWSQGFLWISETLWYLVNHALRFESLEVQREIWRPEVVLFVIFSALLLAVWRRQRSMYLLYAYVYLVLNYSLSWLLSAGRYLSCGLPFFLFTADLTEEKPAVAWGLMAGMGILFLRTMTVYLSGGQIM